MPITNWLTGRIVTGIVFFIGAMTSPARGQTTEPPSPEIIALRTACGGGDRAAMIACYYIGIRYAQGSGVVKNLPQARSDFARACDGGVAEACYNSGYLADNATDRARAYGKSCYMGNQRSCKPYAANAYELGMNGYRNLLFALIGNSPINTVYHFEGVRSEAIGNLTQAAKFDPALAAQANATIAKIRALDPSR